MIDFGFDKELCVVCNEYFEECDGHTCEICGLHFCEGCWEGSENWATVCDQCMQEEDEP